MYLNIDLNIPSISSDIAFGLALGKNVPPEDRYSIVGATDTVFAETSQKSDGTLSAADALTETIDYGSDKATIQLYNGRGYDVYLTRMQIHGKPIMKASGGSGGLVLDSLRRDDDIRRNGEIVKTISNDYIFDATQVQKIADYWYKRCGQKKHLYSLQVKGSALWYEPGEWYTLTLGGAGQNEYISATVECVSVTVQRSAGGIGTTQLLVRECMESWAKTTLYTARLVTGASPKRRTNQSNTLIVASSSFDGTYDYRCDGTSDDVQIQEAIDYLAANGGGTVQRTAGTYTYAAAIVMKDNVVVAGVGPSTIDKPLSASVTTMYDWGTASGGMLKDCTIDGTGVTFITTGVKVVDGKDLGYCNNVTIQNYSFSCTSGVKDFSLFYGCYVTACIGLDNTVVNTGTATSLQIFTSCNNVSFCKSMGNSASGSTAVVFSFYLCTNLTACNSTGNSAAGNSSGIMSFNSCANISSCSSTGNSTNYSSASVFSFYSCTNISSCSSIGNTTGGASSDIYSFFSCMRITVSSTSSNVAFLGNEIGYSGCNSVQQCKSSGDSTPYTTSYADAGTSNACADTAAGGYNN